VSVLTTDRSEANSMPMTQIKRSYRKPVLRRLGLLRRLTRFSF
jgi:hypothetical protein